jgi:hypothetical protein
MKRLFSSVLIALIFFNVMGYYGLLLGLKYKNTREMISQLNNGIYDESETGTLKIPFKDWHGLYSEVFERVDGDFERNGEVYRLIKQRLYRDTFHIVYIKDITGTELNKVISDYVKSFSDTPSKDGKQPAVLLLFIKEYFGCHFSMQKNTAGWEQAVRKESHDPIFIDNFVSSIVHPPERI